MARWPFWQSDSSRSESHPYITNNINKYKSKTDNLLVLRLMQSCLHLCYTLHIMVITYQGGQCFKVSFGDTTIAFDPISKKSKLTPVKFGADAAFISMRHPDFNGREQVVHGAREPFVADGPGEYEIGEVTARGFGMETTYDKEKRFNTIYQVQLEGMNMVFLGALGNPEIDPKILGELGDIDILFVPIGGGEVLDVPQASKLAVKLEAKLIIPMHYDNTQLKAFLKEEGATSVEAVDKLTIKKKDVALMEGEIAVLKV
jgi:L-ascorbate metabolism protein UlaG (beta-lactamase superfamily)